MILPLFLLNCRSRKKELKIEEYRSAEVVKVDTNTVVSNEKKQEELKQTTEKKTKTENDNSGDIIIKGTTDKEKDFHFHNIVEGDTLSEITISGLAEFTIKNRWKKSETVSTAEKKEEYQNIVQEIAQKSVAQSTIKEVAKKIKSEEKTVESKNFTFGAWLVWLLIAAMVVCAVWFYVQFKNWLK